MEEDNLFTSWIKTRIIIDKKIYVNQKKVVKFYTHVLRQKEEHMKQPAK